MIGQTVDAGDHLEKRAAIPLAPCSSRSLSQWFRSADPDQNITDPDQNITDPEPDPNIDPDP